MDHKYYRMAAQEVPVILDVDVVVVGGGFAGVCAAVAAARAGAKVAIVERDGLLGGQAAEVYCFGLDGIFGDAGRQVIKGLPWEIIRRTVEIADADPSWTEVDFATLEREGYDKALAPLGINASWKSDAWVDHNAFRHVLHNLCHEEGVTVLFESPIIGAMLDGDRVTGVIAQGDYGPFAVAGLSVVDTTPYAAVAAAAGHPFPHTKAYVGTHPHVSGVDIRRLIEFVCAHPDDVGVLGVDKPDVAKLTALVDRGMPMRFTGFIAVRDRAVSEDPAYERTGRSDKRECVFFYDRSSCGRHWVQPAEFRFFRMDYPLDISHRILALRQWQWMTHQMFRNYVPGFERARLEDVHPHVARSLVHTTDPGEFTDCDVTWADIQRGGPERDDNVVRVMGHPGKNQPADGWLLPYAAMLPKGLEGLLVTGKPACRFIHYNCTVAAVGQAAGVAGALASLSKSTPRQLAASAVQEELRRQEAAVY